MTKRKEEIVLYKVSMRKEDKIVTTIFCLIMFVLFGLLLVNSIYQKETTIIILVFGVAELFLIILFAKVYKTIDVYVDKIICSYLFIKRQYRFAEMKKPKLKMKSITDSYNGNGTFNTSKKEHYIFYNCNNKRIFEINQNYYNAKRLYENAKCRCNR